MVGEVLAFDGLGTRGKNRGSPISFSAFFSLAVCVILRLALPY